MPFFRLCLFPNVIQSAALGNGEGVIYVVIFLLLLTALFAPIFMQLFGGDFGFIDEDESELRCDTFWQSYLTLIMVSLYPIFLSCTPLLMLLSIPSYHRSIPVKLGQ